MLRVTGRGRQLSAVLLCGYCFGWLPLRYLEQPLPRRSSRVGCCHWPYDSTVVTGSRSHAFEHQNVGWMLPVCILGLLDVHITDCVLRVPCAPSVPLCHTCCVCWRAVRPWVTVGLHVADSLPLNAPLAPVTSAPSVLRTAAGPSLAGQHAAGGGVLTGAVLVLDALSLRCVNPHAPLLSSKAGLGTVQLLVSTAARMLFELACGLFCDV
jgi:hypothetical protein